MNTHFTLFTNPAAEALDLGGYARDVIALDFDLAVYASGASSFFNAAARSATDAALEAESACDRHTLSGAALPVRDGTVVERRPVTSTHHLQRFPHKGLSSSTLTPSQPASCHECLIARLTNAAMPWLSRASKNEQVCAATQLLMTT